MGDRPVYSHSPESGTRLEDGTVGTAVFVSPSPPLTTSTPAPLDSVLLKVYDRCSFSAFTVQIHDPLFLYILNNSVVPAAESDGALPFEIQEFVEYVNVYEMKRVCQQGPTAAKRNDTVSSSSCGYTSGEFYTNNGLARKGANSDAIVAMSIDSVNSGRSSNMNGVSSFSSGSTAPLKLEDTLRLTLSDNSDFFFRVASVAYQLEPTTPYGTATCKAASALPSVSGGLSAGIRGGGSGGIGVGNPLHSTTTFVRAGAAAEGALVRGPLSSASVAAGHLVSSAASGVSAMLANTLATGPRNAMSVPYRHRNYAVDGGYSAAFRLCVRLFAMRYRDHCHALAENISARLSALRVEDCVMFRKAVWASFHLKAEDPLRSATRSESNLELRWVSEKIKDDKHLFPDGDVIPQQQQQQQQQQSASLISTHIVDATLSYVANARRCVHPNGVSSATSVAGGVPQKEIAGGRAAASAAAFNNGGDALSGGSNGAVENEMQTYGLTKLLHNPSWQKDEDSSDTCPSCGRPFLSVGRLLGARAHHCRSCGVRLCVFCITKRAHYSFAKLTKPGSVDEAEDRFVCDACYGEYETTRQLHYLGALFAFAGLGFSDLVLCRTVNDQWREAAELCISEYRLLLHNCDADMHSVMTPVGVLLQNSLFLLLGEGPTSSISVVHHPEAALLLLKYIVTENLWMQDASYYFIQRLSTSILNRADTVLTKLPGFSSFSSSERKNCAFQLPVIPTLSHWHLFCTAFCSRISSNFFFVKCAELLCAAPVRVYDAYLAKALENMTQLYLSTTPLWTRLTSANRATELAFHDLGNMQASFTATSAPLPLPTLSDVTEGQLVTIWLLDMLHRDALVPARRRRYQQLLERVIPSVATSSLSLVFIMLLSLRSTYSYYCYDEELFGQWRSRILAEVARVDAVAKDRVVATLDFYAELDRFCAQSPGVNREQVVDWIVRYCTRGRVAVPAAAASRPAETSAPVSPSSFSPSHPTRSHNQMYVDLPEPMLNPFKPYMVVRSVRISGVRVVPNAATKPIWLSFSTWTAAEHSAYEKACQAVKQTAAEAAAATSAHAALPASSSAMHPLSIYGAQPSVSESKMTPPQSNSTMNGDAAATTAQECLFLYKRENVERDQLMCISSRLLQTLLASEIGNAEMLDYSVLPLSCNSGLIEKAAGRELSDLENMDIASYVLHRGNQGCTNFLASAKIFLLLNYIFSIGDRHKGNVLIGSNGALLHIDFRFIFSEKTFVEKLARSTVRIDDAFLAAVEQCQLRQSAAAASSSSEPKGGAAPVTSLAVAVPSSPSSAFSCTRVSPPQSPVCVTSNSTSNTTTVSRITTTAAAPAGSPPTPAELRAAFFASAAEWFVHVRPFATIFYELWLYAVHRHTVPHDERELLTMLNTLFDRHASQSSSASKFSTTMKDSVNVCRLKDVTHSSAEVLRSFTDQVSRRVSESGAGAVKMMGNMWTSWWTRRS